MEAALEIDKARGVRFGGKESVFSDLDYSPKILKLVRFKMHFFLL